jgi:serine/threonine-protein kinase
MVERYEVLDLLGVGGIATVYRARHRELRSLHALKVLTIDRPSLRERALREGQVQAAIHHPNVVAVTDIVTCGGAPALVLEYVAGPTLERLMATESLGLAEIDLLVRGVLRGVAHAHAQGVVHRDLKPGNVLVADVDGDASQVDVRSDIWSLGVMLYELCTGRRPFLGPSTAELFEQAASGRYPPPQTLVEGLPERMVRAIEGALPPHPARRTPTVAELLATWCGEVTDAELKSRARPPELPPSAGSDRSSRAPTPQSSLSLGSLDARPRTVRPEVVGMSLAVLGAVGSAAALAAVAGVLVGVGIALGAT